MRQRILPNTDVELICWAAKETATVLPFSMATVMTGWESRVRKGNCSSEPWTIKNCRGIRLIRGSSQVILQVKTKFSQSCNSGETAGEGAFYLPALRAGKSWCLGNRPFISVNCLNRGWHSKCQAVWMEIQSHNISFGKGRTITTHNRYTGKVWLSKEVKRGTTMPDKTAKSYWLCSLDLEIKTAFSLGFPGGSAVQNSPTNSGDTI